MDYEAQHQALIEHIVSLRGTCKHWAHEALTGYLAIPDFPWPNLRAEVAAAWAEKTKAEPAKG